MLLSYLKRHYKIPLMLLGFAGICGAVFALYGLPLEAVLYAGALCAALAGLIFVLAFASYRRRCRELEQVKSRALITLDALPEPQGELERTYQELVHILRAETSRLETAAENERRDATDYYTAWAHQIKTPISAMSLLLQSADAELSPGLSAELSAELLHIGQYVEMALGYLRADSGSSDYVLAECELDDLVRAAVRKYARLFILKKLTLDLRPTGLRVLSDEKWLQFVIEQLVSNAVKYTPRGGIAVYAEDGALVVEDTGIGVRAEDLPRVFEKGFTGYNGRADKKSTGIGLYLCRRVCGKLGHNVSLESDGRGTRAKITFGHAERVVE